MKIDPYLHFSGNCEEALGAYASIFGGEIAEMNRYAGSPAESHAPEGWGQKIMHSTFRAPGLELMASDSANPNLGGRGGRVSLAVGLADHDEGARIFGLLAEGGTIAMPYEKQFWGASFGMLTDRFGIDWMVNAG